MASSPAPEDRLPPAPGMKGKRSGLRANMADSKSRNLIIIVGVAGLMAGAYAIYSWNGTTRTPPSVVAAPPALRSEAGGFEQRTNQAVSEAVTTANNSRAREAQLTGTSSMPTFGSHVVPEPQKPVQPAQAEAPPPPIQRIGQATPQTNTAHQAPQQIDLSGMEAQMKAILAAGALRPATVIQNQQGTVGGEAQEVNRQGPPLLPAAGMRQASAGAQAYASGAPSSSASGPRYGRQLARMGDTVYGYTLSGTTSTARTPVMVEIHTEGLLKGARVHGRFQKTDEGLVVTVDRMSLPNGQGTVRASGLLMNPDTQLPTIASDIDRRWFERYPMRLFAAFGSTLASAYSRSNSTVVMSPFGGAQYQTGAVDIGRAAVAGGGRVGEELARELTRSTESQDLPIITVEAGFGVAIVFTDDVVLETQGR